MKLIDIMTLKTTLPFNNHRPLTKLDRLMHVDKTDTFKNYKPDASQQEDTMDFMNSIPDLEVFIDKTIKKCLLEYDLDANDTEAVLDDMEKAWPKSPTANPPEKQVLRDCNANNTTSLLWGRKDRGTDVSDVQNEKQYHSIWKGSLNEYNPEQFSTEHSRANSKFHSKESAFKIQSELLLCNDFDTSQKFFLKHKLDRKDAAESKHSRNGAGRDLSPASVNVSEGDDSVNQSAVDLTLHRVDGNENGSNSSTSGSRSSTPDTDIYAAHRHAKLKSRLQQRYFEGREEVLNNGMLETSTGAPGGGGREDRSNNRRTHNLDLLASAANIHPEDAKEREKFSMKRKKWEEDEKDPEVRASLAKVKRIHGDFPNTFPNNRSGAVDVASTPPHFSIDSEIESRFETSCSSSWPSSPESLYPVVPESDKIRSRSFSHGKFSEESVHNKSLGFRSLSDRELAANGFPVYHNGVRVHLSSPGSNMHNDLKRDGESRVSAPPSPRTLKEALVVSIRNGQYPQFFKPPQVGKRPFQASPIPHNSSPSPLSSAGPTPSPPSTPHQPHPFFLISSERPRSSSSKDTKVLNGSKSSRIATIIAEELQKDDVKCHHHQQQHHRKQERLCGRDMPMLERGDNPRVSHIQEHNSGTLQKLLVKNLMSNGASDAPHLHQPIVRNPTLSSTPTVSAGVLNVRNTYPDFQEKQPTSHRHRLDYAESHKSMTTNHSDFNRSHDRSPRHSSRLALPIPTHQPLHSHQMSSSNKHSHVLLPAHHPLNHHHPVHRCESSFETDDQPQDLTVKSRELKTNSEVCSPKIQPPCPQRIDQHPTDSTDSDVPENLSVSSKCHQGAHRSEGTSSSSSSSFSSSTPASSRFLATLAAFTSSQKKSEAAKDKDSRGYHSVPHSPKTASEISGPGRFTP